MKTFANMCVAAVIVSVAMSSTTAKADFDNQRVRGLAAFVEQLIRTEAIPGLQLFDLSRVDRAFFRTRLNAVRRNMDQIIELSADDDADDQIEDLIADSRNKTLQLLQRANELNIQAFVDGFPLFLDAFQEILVEVD